jgi:pyrroline-5-carboxylate reductase
MGVAILSGVVASLDSKSNSTNGLPKWESHTPGTLTPTGPPNTPVPSRFIACVSREESAAKLRTLFADIKGLGGSVEVVASQNLQAVQQADVVLLWCVVSYLQPLPD